MPGLNPFIVKHKQKMFAAEGVGIGDRVTITWKDFYGGVHTFTGEVTELRDWVRIQGTSSYWHYPVTLIESVRRAS